MSGLEVLGIAAGIIQVADTGLRLSQAVYKYIEDTKGADKRLATFAQDVRRTAEIIQSVGELLQDESARKRVAAKGLATAQSCVEDCKAAFGDVDAFVIRARGKGKWLFSFREPKLLLLDARLEKLKSNLSLMLLVLGKSEELKVALEQKEKKDEASKEALEILLEFKAAKVTASRAELQYKEIEARTTNASSDTGPGATDNPTAGRGVAPTTQTNAVRSDSRHRSASESSTEATANTPWNRRLPNNPRAAMPAAHVSQSEQYPRQPDPPRPPPGYRPRNQAHSLEAQDQRASVMTAPQFEHLVNDLKSKFQILWDQLDELQSNMAARERKELSRIEWHGVQQVAASASTEISLWIQDMRAFGRGVQGGYGHQRYAWMGGSPQIGRGQWAGREEAQVGEGAPRHVYQWRGDEAETDSSPSERGDSRAPTPVLKDEGYATVAEPELEDERQRLRAWQAEARQAADDEESVEDLLREWTNVYGGGEEEEEGGKEESSEAE